MRRHINKMCRKGYLTFTELCTQREIEKVSRLKREGEEFRFWDSRVPELKTEDQFKRGPGWAIVIVAVSLFSTLFILSHPLILCRS